VNIGFDSKVLIWKTKNTGQSKKFEDVELHTLLNENSARSFEKLAKALKDGKLTVSNRLYAMRKIQKEGYMNLSELAIQNLLTDCISLLPVIQKEAVFIVTDKKWIYYDNFKRKKS